MPYRLPTPALAALAAASCILSPGAPARAAAPAADNPAVAADPCPPSLPANWRCLRVIVPQDYAAPEAGTAEVRVVVAPATRPKPKPEAVFLIQGGPGVSGTAVAGAGFVASIGALQANHDLVVVDERQVSGPDALTCPPSGPPEKFSTWGEDVFSQGHLKACLTRSAPRAGLATLTTETFARDLESVRAALGYDGLKFYAANHGGRIVQAYMRRFPGRTRAAVLADTGPMDEPIAWSSARWTLRAVKATLAACGADATCRAAYPHVQAEFDALMARADSPGLEASIAHDGVTETVVFDRATVLAFFGAHFHFMRDVAAIPFEVHELASRDPGRVAAVAGNIAAYQKALFSRLALGVWMSVECAEEAPLMGARLARGERPETGRAADIVAVCETWPHGTPPADFHDPVRSDAPVLLLASPLEPSYPAELAARAARGFSHVRIVVDANHGHVFDDDWQMCLGPEAVGFLESLDLAAVDARCAARFRFRPFRLPR